MLHYGMNILRHRCIHGRLRIGLIFVRSSILYKFLQAQFFPYFCDVAGVSQNLFIFLPNLVIIYFYFFANAYCYIRSYFLFFFFRLSMRKPDFTFCFCVISNISKKEETLLNQYLPNFVPHNLLFA